MADQAPWRRQTLGNQMPADYADSVSAGGGPPPPPPPPLALGAVPAVRLKAEISERRPEPPACVQNAMMTKDKKPFTYTPGGIDLSQIRSPRMARRITRNANAEGVQPDAGRPAGAPQQQHGPLPPSALAAMQPQLPVQVFPTGGGPPAAMAPPPPPPPPPVPGPGAAPIMSQPPSTKAPSPPNSNSQMPYVRPDIKIPENPMGLLRKTGGPHRTQPDVAQLSVPQPVQAAQPVQAVQPPQAVYKPVQPSVTSPIQVVQPPLPQPVYKPVQPPVPSPVQAMPQPVYQPRPAMAVSPEQKQENRQQVGSIYIPPLNSEEMQKSPSTPQKSVPESPGSPMDTLKKAPTPWLTGRVQPKPQDPPAWARSPPESVASSTPTTPATPSTPGTPGVTRVIPIRIERTEDAKDIQQQQQQQQMYQQQQRQQQQQYQQQMQQQMMQQYRQQQQQFQQQPTHSVRMIPIQIEGQMTHVGPMSPGGNMATPDLMGAPVQSPTFRILQRVTSRDEELHSHPAIHHPPSLGHAFPVEQMRKMQLTEDEKALMNRVRNQVDDDCYLHDEVDPRYRGPAIPSRAFRMLQSMTDAAEASGDPTCVPRAVIINRGPQPQGGIRKSNSPRTPDGEGALPPSEQRVPEPRKYTGSAIPSRSFQMLQAMVAPENCGPGQSDL